MAAHPRMNARESVAAAFALAAPVLYFLVTESSKGDLYQTTAEHNLLLITLPIGLLLVGLTERRPPSPGQRRTPVWARLVLGGAAGLLLAAALLLVNGMAADNVRELPGISEGTVHNDGFVARHAVVHLDDGRTVHLRNAFCGVNGNRVTVSIAKGLLGLDRPLECRLPSMRPPPSDLRDVK